MSGLLPDPSGDPALARVALAVPAALGVGRRPGAVILSVPAERLAETLRALPLPGDGVAAVLDPEGRIAARTRRAEALIGRPATPSVLEGLARGDEGLIPRAINQDGQVSIVGYARARPEGFAVVVAMPENALAAPVRAAALRAGAVALALLGAGLAAALLLGGRVRGDLRALSRLAASGGQAPLARGMSEVRAVSAALAEANRGRAAAGEALTRQEARWRALIEATSEIAWITDASGRLLPGSARVWSALSGVEAARLEAEGWPAALDPRDRAEAAARWSEALAAARPLAHEARLRRADGTTGCYSVRAVPLPDAPGRAGEWVGLSVDVTEQRAAEAALRDSEARFRALVEAMPAFIWTSDAQGVVDWFNARWGEYTGAAPGEDEGPGEGWARRVHPEDLARVRDAWTESVARGLPHSAELRLRDREGGWQWFLCQALPVRDEAGRVVRWVGTGTDIGEIVEAREARRVRAEALEREVAARTAALTESERRLARAQRMEALGRLAGGIAHDVNNVLQAVLGGARLIARRPGDAAAVSRLAGLIAEQAERGASVSRRLLGFARQGELRAEPLAPAPLLEGMREVLGATLGAAIEVSVEAPPDLPPLLADRAGLQTVLVNLALNARDAMPGGGRLILSAGAERVGAGHPAGLRPGEYLRLSVSDGGAGMAPEILARISEPFFTTKPEGQGTGLGLAMARGFAEQSGGGLAIESAPGRGTRVRLWLPRSALAPAAPAAPGRAAVLPPGIRVLLVEDGAAVRAVLAEGLRAAGATVEEAEGAAEALRRLERGPAPDALVTDYAMPGPMNGLALLRAARERRPGLPALLVTGYAGEGGVEEAAAGGPFAVLRKPVEAEALAGALSRLLETARAEAG